MSSSTIDPRRVLGDISGGRVLDVATGTGGFVRILLDGLRDHTEIVGIDANGERAAAFSAAFGERADVRFEQMDAHHSPVTRRGRVSCGDERLEAFRPNHCRCRPDRVAPDAPGPPVH